MEAAQKIAKIAIIADVAKLATSAKIATSAKNLQTGRIAEPLLLFNII